MWTVKDYQFMSRAIQLAKRGQYTCDPNPIVGCVITKNDESGFFRLLIPLVTILSASISNPESVSSNIDK